MPHRTLAMVTDATVRSILIAETTILAKPQKKNCMKDDDNLHICSMDIKYISKDKFFGKYISKSGFLDQDS